jgi:hypothetical protein
MPNDMGKQQRTVSPACIRFGGEFAARCSAKKGISHAIGEIRGGCYSNAKV